MGTRHLTCVVVDQQYRVAQYGQWDGYPDGQGLVTLEFCRHYCATPEGREAFKAKPVGAGARVAYHDGPEVMMNNFTHVVVGKPCSTCNGTGNVTTTPQAVPVPGRRQPQLYATKGTCPTCSGTKLETVKILWGEFLAAVVAGTTPRT